MDAAEVLIVSLFFGSPVFLIAYGLFIVYAKFKGKFHSFRYDNNPYRRTCKSCGQIQEYFEYAMPDKMRWEDVNEPESGCSWEPEVSGLIKGF